MANKSGLVSFRDPSRKTICGPQLLTGAQFMHLRVPCSYFVILAIVRFCISFLFVMNITHVFAKKNYGE